MDKTIDEKLSLEERISRLEGRIGWGKLLDPVLDSRNIIISYVVILIGLYCSYEGLKIPNHYYQIVLSLIIVLALYHKNKILLPSRIYGYFLPLFNVIALSFILKLFIGTGKRYPLYWLMFPNITKVVDEEKSSWKNIVPSFTLEWIPGPMAEWSIDLTIVQTFLLLLTILSAMVGFQPFASLIALLLVLFSIPALISFSWPWVFPAILLTALGIYIQSRTFNEGVAK